MEVSTSTSKDLKLVKLSLNFALNSSLNQVAQQVTRTKTTLIETILAQRVQLGAHDG